MEYKYLGNSGLKVSRISYGNWLTGYGEDAQNIMDQCVKRAWELGINFFDTAEAYGFGEGEIAIGKSLKALNVDRQDLVISTKLIANINPFIKTEESKKQVNRIGLNKKHIIEGLTTSLKRLQLDYVDVVFAHRCDDNTPMEEMCRGFNYLIEKGMAFYWGTSEWPAYKIMEAYAVCDRLGLIKPIVEQPQYNMLVRENFEETLGHLFDVYKMGSTIWSPLAGGLLTGKYNHEVPSDSRLFNTENQIYYQDTFFKDQKKAQEKLQALGKIAEELKISQAQLALAWTLKNSDVSTAIVGATKISQLEDNVAAISAQSLLTPEILERIEKILDNKPKTAMDFKTFQPKANRR